MSITSDKIKLLYNPKSVEYYEMLSKKTNQVIHKNKTKKKKIITNISHLESETKDIIYIYISIQPTFQILIAIAL